MSIKAHRKMGLKNLRLKVALSKTYVNISYSCFPKYTFKIFLKSSKITLWEEARLWAWRSAGFLWQPASKDWAKTSSTNKRSQQETRLPTQLGKMSYSGYQSSLSKHWLFLRHRIHCQRKSVLWGTKAFFIAPLCARLDLRVCTFPSPPKNGCFCRHMIIHSW